MSKKLKPVSIANIEADALISISQSYTADIPQYPVEKGFSVSDTIIMKPIAIDMELYISDIPVTWRNRKGHSPSIGRTKKICKKFEDLYFQKKLVKVVTSDSIYTNMGIESISINNAAERGYDKKISLSLKKVYTTNKKTVKIPKYVLQNGETAANAGKAATSSSSAKESTASGSAGKGSAKSKSTKQDSTKKSSILYGIASKTGFI